MLQNTSPKLHNKFECIICNYACSKKSDMEKHNVTRKHTDKANITVKVAKQDKFECNFCNKIYNSRVGLWYHNKKCTVEPLQPNTELQNQQIIELLLKENAEMKHIVLEIVKSNGDIVRSNSELQKQLVDVCKNTNNNTNNINNSNIHSNNKTFNLQFFLNEQCKDAMNISDFANSIDLQLSDLESVGELGYVEGITKIMLDKLNSMDIYKRPIHCSDAKREILYVKDHDVWEKEERNNPKLRYAIKTISFNNMKLMGLWSSTYPECLDGESRLNDKYMVLIKQSTGGNGEISISEDKIIRRIAKEILIDKK